MLELTNINYFVILMEGILFHRQFKNRKKAPLIIVSAQLILLLGLRGLTVGGDTQTYANLFLYTVNGSVMSYLEWGACYLMVFLAKITSAPTVLLLVYAVMTILPISYVSYKESKNIFFSMVIYAGLAYYYWAFNAMRQAVAMSFGMIAVYYLNKKKIKKYFIWLILAMAFHKSAAILLVCLIAQKAKLRVSKRWVIIVPVLSCLMVAFTDKILLFALRFFSSYMTYASSSEYFGRGNVMNPMLFMAIFIFLVLANNQRNEEIDFGLMMLAIGVVLYFASIKVKILNRMPYYFTLSLIILLPNIVESLRENNRRISKIIFYSGVSIYQLLLVLQGAQGIAPYCFFWQ